MPHQVGGESDDEPMEKVTHNRFIYLNQSQGGVFSVPFCDTDGITKTNSIGTDDCWNCVCVYVPLDKEFCFVAHIDAWVCASRSDIPNSDMIPPKGSEQSLKDRVKQMLKEEILPFVPKEGLTEEWNRQSIMLNVRPTIAFHGVATKATGFYIAEAIQEFFGLLGSSDDMHARGFVVNHVTGKREYFRWSDKRAATKAQDYDRFEKHLQTYGEESEESKLETRSRQYPAEDRKLLCGRKKHWRFGYHGGKWYSKDEMLSNGYWNQTAWTGSL